MSPLIEGLQFNRRTVREPFRLAAPTFSGAIAMAVQTLERSTSPTEHHNARQLVEQQFFDSLVRDRGSFNPFADRGWETIERRFQESVADQVIDSLLDIGCGTGESRKLYINHVGDYIGLDLSPASIAFAQKRFPESRWIVADACGLPYAEGCFDVVAFSSVLHHIEDYGRALREARRVLKPGGTVFAFDPNAWHPAMALFRCPESPWYIPEGVSPNERPLRPVGLRRAFQEAGFVSIKQRCQSNIGYRWVAPKLINACLSVYNLVDQAWEACGLGRWFGTFAVTVGRKPSIVSKD